MHWSFSYKVFWKIWSLNFFYCILTNLLKSHLRAERTPVRCAGVEWLEPASSDSNADAGASALYVRTRVISNADAGASALYVRTRASALYVRTRVHPRFMCGRGCIRALCADAGITRVRLKEAWTSFVHVFSIYQTTRATGSSLIILVQIFGWNCFPFNIVTCPLF